MDENYLGIIYKAQNSITGQIYIGATTYELKQRKLDHIERAIRGDKGYFQEAIGTYGPEAFSWETIDTAENIDELAKKEKHYIYQYNSKVEGYNRDEGGGFQKTVYQYSLDGGLFLAKYDCLNDAASAVNTTKQHISRACLSVNNIYKDFYWSYLFEEPFSPKSDNRRKKVLQLSLDGEFLNKFKSVAEASRDTGVSKTCISRVCRGERENSGGFCWRYL